MYSSSSSSLPSNTSTTHPPAHIVKNVEKKKVEKKKNVERRSSTSSKKKKQKSKFLENNIAGHSKRTICGSLSSDGELIAVANAEGRVYVYSRSTLKNPSPRYHLLKDMVDVTAMSFHSDGNVLVCACIKDRKLRFYGLPKLKSTNEKQKQFATHLGSLSDGGRMKDIETGHTGSRISSVIFASTGVKPFVVTCASGGSGDTSVRFFNLRGKLLANVNSHQIQNVAMSISSDSRFVAVSSLSSEVKILCIHRNKKTGVFEKVTKAMSLTGHTDSVQAVRFGFYPLGSYRIVSGSNDGTIAMWDTDVRYDLGVNPTRLCEKKLGGVVRAVALSPDTSLVAAILVEKLCVRLCFVSVLSSKNEMTSIVLEDCYAEPIGTKIWQLLFFPDGKSVFSLIPGCKNAQVYQIPT